MKKSWWKQSAGYLVMLIAALAFGLVACSEGSAPSTTEGVGEEGIETDVIPPEVQAQLDALNESVTAANAALAEKEAATKALEDQLAAMKAAEEAEQEAEKQAEVQKQIDDAKKQADEAKAALAAAEKEKADALAQLEAKDVETAAAIAAAEAKAKEAAEKAAQEKSDKVAAEQKGECKLGKLADARQILLFPKFRDNGHYDDDVRVSFSLMKGDEELTSTDSFRLDGNDNGKIDDLSPELTFTKTTDRYAEACLEDITGLRIYYRNFRGDVPYAHTKCTCYKRRECCAWRKADVWVDRALIKIEMSRIGDEIPTYLAHVSEPFGKENHEGSKGNWTGALATCGEVNATPAFEGTDEFGRSSATICKDIGKMTGEDGELAFDYKKWPK